MDITPIIRAVVVLICAVITSVVIPLIRSKVTEQQLHTARTWVTIAVEAAEQIYKGSGMGKEKKAFVLEFLEQKGLKIDLASIDNLIEAAVLELKR